MTAEEKGTSVCAVIIALCAGFIIGGSLVTMMWAPRTALDEGVLVLIGIAGAYSALRRVLR